MKGSGPLVGLRVVELDAIGPVPLACMILADLGCDVVRVARRVDAAKVWDDVGGAVLHRNRGHVEADLKSADDRAKVLDLVAEADALIEGFRPGVMERLGLGPDECLARNPELAFVRMTGWGQSGPLAPRAGHDINYIALTGALHAMGEAGGPPPPPLNFVGDYGSGAMFAIVGLLSAVMSARATGKGQVVDVAMVEGAAVLSGIFHAFLASGAWSDRRGSNLVDGSAPFYRCYRCADDEFVAVGALEPQFFALLLDGLGIARDRFDQHDKAGWREMEAAFQQLFLTKPRDAWSEVFEGVDACVSPVLSFTEAPGHPHNASRGAFVTSAEVVQPSPAPRFSETAPGVDPARTGIRTLEDAIQSWRS